MPLLDPLSLAHGPCGPRPLLLAPVWLRCVGHYLLIDCRGMRCIMRSFCREELHRAPLQRIPSLLGLYLWLLFSTPSDCPSVCLGAVALAAACGLWTTDCGQRTANKFSKASRLLELRFRCLPTGGFRWEGRVPWGSGGSRRSYKNNKSCC